MTVVASASAAITALDTVPIVVPTAGEGNPGRAFTADDYVTTTAAQMGSIGSTLRLCRIPSQAKVKQVLVNIGGVDTNATATAVFDFNLAWSDSTLDGTRSGNQAAIPTSSLNGTNTTVAAYSSPNIIFGQVSASNSGAKIVQKDITFNGTLTAALRQVPLWSVFGYTNPTGFAQNPGGYFDLLVYLSTAAATGAAAVVAAEVRYTV